MKIKHVEELVGITRKNIRFYEEQGLLSPGRADNGYREYHEEDVQRLKQIKFLRKLFVPIEEIKAVLSGSRSLEQCLEHQLSEIGRRRDNLDEIEGITKSLLSSADRGAPLSLDRLDVDACLENITRLEKEGKEFMDLSVNDIHRKKTVSASLAALAFIALMAFLAILIWWGNSTEPLPAGLFAVLIGIPVVIIVCVIAVLVQRIKEIKGGEEDEASKY